MYVPEHFRVTDRDEIERFIAEHAFGTLVTSSEGGTHATHLPFLVERRGTVTFLRGHVARANPHWRQLDGARALAVFVGPHDYISPRWYSTRDSVPTWDYATVHAEGTARLIGERGEVLTLLAALAERYEGDAPDAWRITDLNGDALERFVRAIVAFEIEVRKVDASFKLSQNRSSEDRAGVTAALRERGNHALADAIERRNR
jgi:transcriptional regulator